MVTTSSPPTDDRIETTVVAKDDAPGRAEVAQFMASLTEERQWFVTPADEVVGSELLIVARIDGPIVGVTGISRRFVQLPFGYYVVRQAAQSKGVARALYQAKLPFLKAYPCVFAIIMSGNQRTVSWARRRTDRVFYDDGEYAYVCSAQIRPLGYLIAGALRLALPPALALRRAYQRRLARRGSRD